MIIENKEVENVENVETKEVQPSVEELQKLYEEEKATRLRILEEKRQVKSKATELEEQLEKYRQLEKERKLNEMSVEDRYKTILTEKEDEINTYKSSYTQKEQELNNLQRKIKLHEISGDIRFKSDIPSDVRSYAIEKAFAEIDLDDINQVRQTKQRLIDQYKSLILTDTPKGAGSDPKSNEVVNIEDNITPEMYLAMSKEQRVQLSQNVRSKLFGKG